MFNEIHACYVEHGLVREGPEKMAEKFASPDHIGPNFVADVEDVEDEEDRAMLKRDVFERADYLLRGLGIRQALTDRNRHGVASPRTPAFRGDQPLPRCFMTPGMVRNYR